MVNTSFASLFEREKFFFFFLALIFVQVVFPPSIRLLHTFLFCVLGKAWLTFPEERNSTCLFEPHSFLASWRHSFT